MELIDRLEKLTDEQICKAALWFIDDLKEYAQKETGFPQHPSYDKNNCLDALFQTLGDSDSLQIVRKWEDQKKALLFSRHLLGILATDPSYTKDLEEMVESVGKTRMGGEITTLLDTLKDTIPLWLILYLSLKFKIRFKVENEQKEKRRFEFEVEFGKRESLKEFLNTIFKNSN